MTPTPIQRQTATEIWAYFPFFPNIDKAATEAKVLAFLAVAEERGRLAGREEAKAFREVCEIVKAFGAHHPDCAVITRVDGQKRPCDCGHDAAIASLDPKPEQQNAKV